MKLLSKKSEPTQDQAAVSASGKRKVGKKKWLILVLIAAVGLGLFFSPGRDPGSGGPGVNGALSSGLPLRVHYDKTPDSGAVVRVIAVEET